MNARYYVPSIGRFASADTIVPEPGEPQSLNRYSYVRNQPLIFTDPSGHRECGIDCNNPLPYEGPPSLEQQVRRGSNLYGIVFAEDPGERWSEQEMLIALRGVAAVDRQLRTVGNRQYYMPGTSFRAAFGSITLVRSSRTEYIDTDGNPREITYGAETFGSRIEFYHPAFGVDPLDPKFRNNVVHELGHAFNAVTNRATNGTVNPYGDLTVALSKEGELYDFRLSPRDGMQPYPWQQHGTGPYSNTPGELFADYFLNWTYSGFRNNPAGVTQYDWMSQQMSIWNRR